MRVPVSGQQAGGFARPMALATRHAFSFLPAESIKAGTGRILSFALLLTASGTTAGFAHESARAGQASLMTGRGPFVVPECDSLADHCTWPRLRSKE